MQRDHENSNHYEAELGMDAEPAFIIDEERLAKVCESVARNNNELARSVGQPERLTASELMDLYYAQGGRCALTGCPLEYHESLKHYRRIQLDHIVERKARRVVANAIAGNSPTEYGKIACISNVQWVCRFANWIKEYIRSAGLDYADTVRAMAQHADEGFLLRSGAAHLGAKGKREFREKVVREMLGANRYVTAVEVLNALRGTPGESCYQRVIMTMKQCGWDSSHEIAYMDQRRAVIASVIAKHGVSWSTVKDLAKVVNAGFVDAGMKPLTSCDWIKNEAMAINAGVTFARTRKRNLCQGDKRAFVEWLRKSGEAGHSVEECVDFFESRGIKQDAISEAIASVVHSGAVYEASDEGRLIAALTRDEAAATIGVSPNRLKKWGTRNWDALSGPAFTKASDRGRTYYRHEDIRAFSESRNRHALDLSVAGRRESCVAGGSLGGRPQK